MAYVLLGLLCDPQTAEAQARGWAEDCLARMADPPRELLAEPQPSLVTLRCARAACAAADRPAVERAWQHRALMDRATALL